MTKILTVLVAAEQIEEKNLDDKVTILQSGLSIAASMIIAIS